MATPQAINFAETGSPYTLNFGSLNTGNYAENKYTLVCTGSGTIVLPAAGSLVGGSVDLFIVTSNGAVTVATVNGDTFVNPSGSASITVAASGGAEVTPCGFALWFVRAKS
jgi:hypothetical protein